MSEQEKLKSLAEKLQGLTVRSKGNKECILDVLFTAVEVEHDLSQLKRKVAGPEGLMAEQLQEAGGDMQVEKCVKCSCEVRGGSQHTKVRKYYCSVYTRAVAGTQVAIVESLCLPYW